MPAGLHQQSDLHSDSCTAPAEQKIVNGRVQWRSNMEPSLYALK